MIWSDDRILVCGHEWHNATDVTTAGPVHRLEDVVEAGGRVPEFVTGTFRPFTESRRDWDIDHP